MAHLKAEFSMALSFRDTQKKKKTWRHVWLKKQWVVFSLCHGYYFAKDTMYVCKTLKIHVFLCMNRKLLYWKANIHKDRNWVLNSNIDKIKFIRAIHLVFIRQEMFCFVLRPILKKFLTNRLTCQWWFLSLVYKGDSVVNYSRMHSPKSTSKSIL